MAATNDYELEDIRAFFAHRGYMVKSGYLSEALMVAEYDLLMARTWAPAPVRVEHLRWFIKGWQLALGRDT